MPQPAYLTIDSLTAPARNNRLQLQSPMYFTSSNNRKFVRVLLARLFNVNDGSKINASLHSTLDMLNYSANRYICACNEVYSEAKSYEIGNVCSVEMWFSDSAGNVIPLDEGRVRGIVELELVC